MTGNKRKLTVTLAISALLVIGAVSSLGVAGAQTSEDSVIDVLFSDDERITSDGPIQAIQSSVMGFIERVAGIGNQGKEADADTYAENVRSTLNTNSGTITTWVNNRTDASTEYDTLRVKMTDKSGNTEWVFLVADVNSSTDSYENFRALNLSEFQGMDREIDQTFTLNPYASRNANQELETFISDYAEPGKDVNSSYLTHLAGEYRGQIDGTDLPGGS